MFHMFIHSPPARRSVSRIYREKHPFGPFLFEGAEHESNSISIQVNESAPENFRQIRSICRGSLRVLGPTSDTTPSSLMVALIPFVDETQALRRICQTAQLEIPTVFYYIGVDKRTLLSQLRSLILDAEAFGEESGTWENRSGYFLNGRRLFVPAGIDLAEISSETSEEGYRTLGFGIGTEIVNLYNFGTGNAIIGNFLDPLSFFHVLNNSVLHDGRPALAEGPEINSWMKIATNRILFTFRDEWNDDIHDGTLVNLTADGTTSTYTLSINMLGTIAALEGTTFEMVIQDKKISRISDRESPV